MVFINNTGTYYEGVLLTNAISGACPFDSSIVVYNLDVPDSTTTTPQVANDEQGNLITGSLLNITGITLRVNQDIGNNPGRRFSIPFCISGSQFIFGSATGVLLDEPTTGVNSNVAWLYDVGNGRLTIIITQ